MELSKDRQQDDHYLFFSLKMSLQCRRVQNGRIYRFVPDVFITCHVLFFKTVTFVMGDRGSSVVKVLYYKSEGLWFDPS